MAEFGRANAADLHHLRPLPIPGSPLVACRICDAVFSSSQALINHIGAHVSDEGASSAAASRRQSQQRSQTHRLPPGPPRATAMFLPSRYSVPPNSLGFDAAESLWPNQLSPFARSLFREGPPSYPPPVGQYLTNWNAAEEASGDCTKPYINQLEKCLPKVGGGGGEEDDGRQLYFSKLDLTLRL